MKKLLKALRNEGIPVISPSPWDFDAVGNIQLTNERQVQVGELESYYILTKSNFDSKGNLQSVGFGVDRFSIPAIMGDIKKALGR